MSFVHLYVKSGYSLYESINTIEDLVKKSHEQGFNALALTDEHVLFGAISFYKMCKKYNIKPIIGMTTYVTMDDQSREPCILLAKNNQGYQQLIYLSTFLNIEQKNLTFNHLKRYTNDLIGILPVSTSRLAYLLLESTYDSAKKFVHMWKSLFKQDDFYLGIEDYNQQRERVIHEPLKVFHEMTNTSVVAIQDVRYIEAGDVYAYDCLQAMKHGKRWSNAQIDVNNQYRYLRSKEEMEQIFAPFWSDVLQETVRIAEKCNVSFNFKHRYIPSYPVPEERDANAYLAEICWENVRRKYREITPEIKERLSHELNIIKEMGFSDYFLIVWDFISFAKQNDILVGPGRGSSSSSIVAYVLDITEVDPLEHNLLFERFLNPERVTMPDIDIDFSDHRRDEVIRYVRDKYGEEHVAQIITFGTFAPRSALREVIKTLGIDKQDEWFIMKHIPVQGNKSIRQYVRERPALKDYIKQSERLQLLFSVATKLEGLPRHISTHAAGIVLSDEPLIEHVPLTLGSGETKLTQFAMDDLEAIGLLKIDLLGLRNLSLLERIVATIRKQEKKQIRLFQIPSNDEKTFKLLQRGRTNGIFQLESRGMKRVLQELKPSTFEDIVAVNALYRPGPMDYIPVYIRRKHGKEQIVYPHENLKPILKSTYGVLVYQEQIMQIVYRMASFTYGEADILRRAISTKQEQLMQDQKEKFIKGCLQNGYEQSVAEEIFSWILKFSDYGFPKSHATAYSKISYELSYLKAHYPAYFFAELLSTVMNQPDKTSEYIKEARQMDISILPPSINNSFGKYTVIDQQIQMGLQTIKGIGYQTVREIIRARKKGPFKDLFDFCLRVSLQVVNRPAIEKLILAGAFDEMYSNRASLLASLEQAMEQGELFGDFVDQASLFQHDIQLKSSYVEMEDFTQIQKLTNEKELLGLYVSSHPLAEYREQLTIRHFIPISQLRGYLKRGVIKCACIIQKVKSIRTKRGDEMAFLQLSDETGDIQAVVFPDVYRQKKWLFEKEQIIWMTGEVDERNGRLQIVIREASLFEGERFKKTSNQRLFIKITNLNQRDVLQKLRKIASNHRGEVPIIIYHSLEQRSYQLTEEYQIHPNSHCMEQLYAHFGKDNVVLQA